MPTALAAALDLIHEGPPPERIMEHASYCPKERRRVSRHRVHLDHAWRVIQARASYYGPRWTPGAGLRTVRQ
jgi:hypothetical protein